MLSFALLLYHRQTVLRQVVVGKDGVTRCQDQVPEPVSNRQRQTSINLSQTENVPPARERTLQTIHNNNIQHDTTDTTTDESTE